MWYFTVFVIRVYLSEEFHQLAVQKKQDYAEYRQIRKEKEELLIAKRTVETILNIDRQKEHEILKGLEMVLFLLFGRE